jgi:hypothetical protein
MKRSGLQHYKLLKGLSPHEISRDPLSDRNMGVKSHDWENEKEAAAVKKERMWPQG